MKFFLPAAIQLLLQRGSHVLVMCRGLLYCWSIRRIKATEHWQQYYLLVCPLVNFALIKNFGKFLEKETIQLAEAS